MLMWEPSASTDSRGRRRLRFIRQSRSAPLAAACQSAWPKNCRSARHSIPGRSALSVEVTEHRHWRPSPQASILPASTLWLLALSSEEGDTTKMRWIVSWRGLDEEFPSAADAIDRLDQLEARGIEAEIVETVARRRRRIT